MKPVASPASTPIRLTRRPGRIVCGLLFLLLCGTPIMRLPSAQATWGENYGSVHFNSGEPDFGTPPRRAIFPGDDSRPGSGSGGGGMSGGPVYTEFHEGDLAERAANIARRRAALHKAWEATLARGEWQRAKIQIEQEIKALGATGSLRDRVEVLNAVLKLQKIPYTLTQSLHTYFFGLRVSDESPNRDDEALAAFQKGFRDPTPDFLRAHSLYQLACLSYQRKEGWQALRLFEQIGRDFPRWAKKPAVLLMTARAGLLLPADEMGRDVARRALDKLRHEFPQSRYNRAAQGLYGRYWYLTGQYEKAADTYLGLNDVPSLRVVRPLLSASARSRLGPRLLAACLYGMEQATNYYEYITALKGVDREMQELTPNGATVFVQRLLREPGLAAPYFYYRLYCTDTAAFTKDANVAASDDTRKAHARIASSRRNLLRLAERIVARSGASATRLSAPVRLRLAEVYYQEGRYREALHWVPSLDSGASGTRFVGGDTVGTDRALYVRGAIYQKQRKNRAATADFERLLTRCPNSPLRPAAREELAILYEAAGRNDAALDAYFTLHYSQDIAYLLDVRMTTSEVAAYLAAHPHHPKFALLIYSLGVRYLRDDDLPSARRALKRLTRKQYAGLSNPTTEWGGTFEGGSPDPLRVIDALVTLRQTTARARSREARAMAMYHEASYHYKNGLLLFYNAALWKGDRVFDFDVFWNRHQMTTADRGAIRRHMYRHEVYVRVIHQCRQIAREYPNTTAAPLALYRAACAADHLSGLNQWWESEENHRHFEGQAAALLRQLARRYPRHPLGHNARKYAAVFADEENEAQKAWAAARKHPGNGTSALAY